MSSVSDEVVDLSGRTIGSYRIVRRLGVGGMGAVYLAEHANIGSRVAIKVLHPLFARQSEVVARFFNEARAVNVVQHQSIVSIYDYGQDDQLGAYLVMEFLAGQSLEERLQREGRLSLAKTAALVRKIASPLTAVHARGIIHRDLKPANIILLPDADHEGEERIKLLDFGIAKLTDSAGLGPSQTRTGMLMGTPLYMSPEQCAGDTQVDLRADVYALGVIAYEMLCGRPPFWEGGYGTILASHITKEPPSLREWAPDVPLEVEAAVLQALVKDRDQRFSSIAAFANALHATVQSVGTAAHRKPGGAASYPRTMLHTGPPSAEQLAAAAAAWSTGPQVQPTAAIAPTALARPDFTPSTPATQRVVTPAAMQAVTPHDEAVAEQPSKTKPRRGKTLWIVLVLLVLLGAGGAAAYVLTRPNGDPEVGSGSGTGSAAGTSTGSAAGTSTGSAAGTSPKPGTASPKPGTASPKPGTASPKPGTASPKPKPRAKTFYERLPKPVLKAYRRRDYRLTLQLARKYLRREKGNKDLWAIGGMAACQLKAPRFADAVYKKLRGYRKRLVRDACKRKGIPMD